MSGHSDLTDKVLCENLSRVNDWLRYAESKNVALLSFCSAAVVGSLTAISISSLGTQVRVDALVVVPFWLIGIVCAIGSFLPTTRARKIIESTSKAEDNLLFFGNLRTLNPSEAGKFIAQRYIDPEGRELLPQYIIDIGEQIVINSDIAGKKLALFNVGGMAVVIGLASLIVVLIVPLIHL